MTIALIGFGEAGGLFAQAGRWTARVYDRLTDLPATRPAKLADYAAAGVEGCDRLSDALTGADLILSLVTADQALAVARDAAATIRLGALYCDMNSIAPDTKRAAAERITAAGGRYVDVAVMAPVDPAALAVPLLLSGPEASDAAAWLKAVGFSRTRIVGDAVGRASAIKMIRSVLVKGLEALTTECALAAEAAGVADEVMASLDASWPGADWTAKADYNLDRMMVHGERRAAEMEEVVKTLDGLGTGSAMSRGTAERQRAIGRLGLSDPPPGLAVKMKLILRKAGAA